MSLQEHGLLPGTVLLVHEANDLRAQHVKGNDIVLVPAPTSDPEDPLNWKRGRKIMVVVCMCLYFLACTLCHSNLTAAIAPFSEIRGITVATINEGVGYMFLMAGWGLLFWTPFSLKYGKRLSLLLSVLGNLGCVFWATYCNSKGEWIVNRLIAGFFVAPGEAIPETMVTDVFFVHEHGMYMGLYAYFLTGGMYIGPVLYGFIANSMPWQWLFYWPTIFAGIFLVFLFFFMEETSYNRPRSTVGRSRATESGSASEDRIRVTKEKDADQLQITSSSPSQDPEQIQYRKKRYIQRVSLWQPQAGQNPMRRVVRIFQYFSWPVVFYCGFTYGTYLVWFNVLNATSSVLLSGSPYNFKPDMVGLTYLASLVGSTFATLFCGRLSDWLTMKLTRRNKGIMEAEHRLWPFALCLVLLPLCLILWGVGASQEIHWFGLLVAMAGLGFTNNAGISISLNYLVASYHDLSSEMLATVIIIRNTLAFAINYGITPWFEDLGFQNCFIVAGVAGMVFAASFLFMVKYGKTLRKRSAATYFEYVSRDLLD